MFEVLDHPFSAFLDSMPLDDTGADLLPKFEKPIDSEKAVTPTEEIRIAHGVHGRAGEVQLVDIEAGGHGSFDVGRVNDRERDDDSARPGRHLIDEIEREQNDFGRNG